MTLTGGESMGSDAERTKPLGERRTALVETLPSVGV